MRKIIRFSSLTTLLLATVAGASLFWVSQQVQEIERGQRQIRQTLEREREAIRVLSAEWDYLNRPDRLEALSAKHLTMESGGTDNIVQSINAIPEPLEMPMPPRTRPVFISNLSSSSEPARSPSPHPVVTKPESAPIRDTSSQSSPDFSDVLNSLGQEGDR